MRLIIMSNNNTAQSSVYKIHCITFKLAQQITNNAGLTSSIKGALQAPFCLRIVKQYRNQEQQAFRNLVALEVLKLRGAL